MKIRSKISLWITSAGILVSLVFSLVVFWEMQEQTYRQLDGELKATAANLCRIIELTESEGGQQPTPAAEVFLDSQRYWLRAWRSGKLIYASSLARIVDLPLAPGPKKYSLSITVPREKINLDQDRNDRVTFRVRTLEIPAAAPGYLIQVALPMEKIKQEINEVTMFIILGLVFSTLLLILISYFLAGRIIKPVRRITQLAREIDDHDLASRIPLNASRDELYELATALNQMLDRLQYSFTQQKELIASAAHELNTPLSNLRLFVEQTLNDPKTPTPFALKLSRQHQIILRMSRLLRNLMVLSALELRGKIEPATFDCKTMLQSVIDDFQPLLTQRNIALETSLPDRFEIHGDPEQLRRVIVNIIENAIKYNQPGPEGRIRISLEKVKPGLRLRVANRSQPLAKEDLEKVFEQFYRVEKSRSPEFGGCGLGLTIAREIVNLHGGKIYFENQPEGWVQVVVQLPGLT